MKALVADLYLDDLRDKTRRGLQGRARRGYSTGGLPTGYRSEPDPSGEGQRIVIDEERAALVRRVFRMYVAGDSFTSIAKHLQEEGVPSPRAHTKHRQKGWSPETIRAWLYNEAYVGRWAYGRREWRKAPGTNARRPRARAESDVMAFDRPDLRIIDDELWQAVQARLEAVRALFCGNRNQGFSRVRGSYILSGLLECGLRGGSMTIIGRNYYGCTAAKKRGTCANTLSLREEVARKRILAELRSKLTRPAAIRHLRKRVAEALGSMGRNTTAKMAEHEARLARTKARIDKLMMAIADGFDSESARMTMKDLEAQARAERAAIEELKRAASEPVKLPSVDAIVKRALDIERMVEAEPLRGREALRRYFEDGRIVLKPGDDGVYTARSRVLPLVLLGPQSSEAQQGAGPGGQFTMPSCAGRI